MPPRSFLKLSLAAVLYAFALSVVALAIDTPKERTPPKAPALMPFDPSEQLVYEGEFSKLLLRGIKIAELRFSASRAPATTDAQTSAAPQIQFTSDIESKGWFRKLFGINFRYHVETTIEPSTFAVLRTSKIDEQGKRVRTSEAIFDHADKRVEWTERDPNNAEQPPRVVTAALEGPTQDIISAIYFLRTVPLTPGHTFNLAVSDSGRVYQIPGTVTNERKKIKSVMGRVSVVRLDIDLFGEGRPVQGKGKMSLWVTDDDSRIPIKARLSHEMGQLDITLKSIQRAAAQ
jgi:hypothetical protein